MLALTDTKITVNVADLLAAARDAASVVDPRPVNPTLSCVLLRVKNGLLTCTGTNLQTTFTSANVDVDGEGDFTACVEAKTLVEVLSKLGRVVVSLVPDGLSLVVNAPSGRYRLPGQDPVLFPAGEKNWQPTCHGDVDAADLKHALVSALPWVKQDKEGHTVLSGVLLREQGGQLSVIGGSPAGLSHLLCGYDGKLDSLVLPGNTVARIASYLDEDGTVQIEATKTKAKFLVERGELSVTLFDDVYPDCLPMLARPDGYTVEVDKDSLLAAIRRVRLFAEKEVGRLLLDLKPLELRLRAITPDASGEGSEWLGVQYTGEPMTLAFNAVYLEQAISAMPKGVVSLLLVASTRPVLIEPVIAEGAHTQPQTTLLMPLKAEFV